MNNLKSLTKNKDYDSIKKYLESLPTTEKGKIFEEYIEYLLNGNGLLAKRVGGRSDMGADILVYNPKTPDRVDTIIQTKNHSNKLSFDDTKIELIKFEDKGSSKYNCSFYKLISINGYVKDAFKLSEFNMALDDWDYVKELISNYSDDRTSFTIDLRPHNKLSYDKVSEGFEINNRICVIQATGTGKSYVIAKLIEENIDKKILLLAPSHYILNQFEENFHFILSNTELKTYAKLSRQKSYKDFDIIILDEFHRCGAEIWGKGVEGLLNNNKKSLIFGTTATPIRTLDKGRDISDELFDGYIANNISLPQAIVQSILPSPKYITALYNIDEEVTHLSNKINESKNTDKDKSKYLEQIKNAKIDWEKTKGIPQILKKNIKPSNKAQKYVVFTSDIEQLSEMELDVQKWFLKAFGSKYKREIFRVTSHDSSKKENEEILHQFKNASNDKTIYLMFCIDMLNEGIHISDVDGVILLRKTASDRIFLQQIGRCLQVGSKSNNPLIFDLVNNFKSLKSYDFKNSLDTAGKRYNEQRKKSGLDKKEFSVDIIDECKDIVQLFNEINNSINSWSVQYEYLKEFIDKNKRYPDYRAEYPEGNNLGNWIVNQRQKYSKNILDKEKIDLLNDINFIWDLKEFKWNTQYNYLKEFIGKNERFPLLTEEYPKNNLLGKWIKILREENKKGSLSKKRIDLLNDMDFIWDSYEFGWNKQYNYLKEFIDKNKSHPNFRAEYPEGNNLGSWINTQRSDYKKGTLEKEKIDLLNDINFIWNPHELKWNKQYNYLKEFIEKNERFLLRTEEYPKGNKLGGWISRQKIHYQKGTLEKEKIDLLNDINFIWNPHELKWNKQYNYLKEFIEKNERFPLVTEEYPKGNKLGGWLNSQKKHYKKDEMNKERIEKLKSIGVIK